MDKTNENTREQTYVTIGHIEGDAFREQVTTLLINEKLVKHCECCGRLIRNFEVPDKTGYQAFGREFGKNNRKFKLNAGRPLLGEDYNKGKEYVKYILAEASTIVKNCNFVPDPHGLFLWELLLKKGINSLFFGLLSFVFLTIFLFNYFFQ